MLLDEEDAEHESGSKGECGEPGLHRLTDKTRKPHQSKNSRTDTARISRLLPDTDFASMTSVADTDAVCGHLLLVAGADVPPALVHLGPLAECVERLAAGLASRLLSRTVSTCGQCWFCVSSAHVVRLSFLLRFFKRCDFWYFPSTRGCLFQGP